MRNEITCDYKNVKCISNMEDKYLDSFEKLVDEYGPRLMDKIQISNSVFTLHNFNEHCFNLYKMISYVLLEEKLVYSGPYALSQIELYILNLAVLFHDIGMSECLTVERENHSIKSAQFIEKEWEKKDSVFCKSGLLNNNEIEALKAIIIAHSDVKDSTVTPEVNGLLSPSLDAEILDKNRVPIRTRFLAGVLRVADELDITSERLGNSNIEEQIEYWTKQFEEQRNEADVSEKEISKIQSMLVSLTHWKRLHYISYVKRESGSEDIKIIVDDTAIQKAFIEGNSWDSLADTLFDICEEVDTKLSEAINLCFSKSEMKICVPAKKVILITQIAEIRSSVDKMSSRKSFSIVADERNNSNVKNKRKFEKKIEGQCEGEVCVPSLLDKKWKRN